LTMQVYPNQDLRTKDGWLFTDGDPLTHQDDLPMEQGGGAFVLSCAAFQHICTELLNRLNSFARVNEQRVMTDIRGRIVAGLSTPFRMRRKQEIVELTHDPTYLDPTNSRHKKIYGLCLQHLDA
jgi:hypothetical protein